VRRLRDVLVGPAVRGPARGKDVTPAPLRRKRPGPEEKEDCDCCEADCDCTDCERCREESVQVARDWIPPPAGTTVSKKRAR
jgi:hypothetical protein